MKLKIPANMTPRNPLVAAARFRLAGKHRRGNGAKRQRSQRDLLTEIRHIKGGDDARAVAPHHRKHP